MSVTNDLSNLSYQGHMQIGSKRNQFRISTLFVWMTLIASYLGAWQLNREFSESQIPLWVIAVCITLAFLGVASVRTVFWATIVAGLASVLVFSVVYCFELLPEVDRKFYIVSYSTLVAAAGAISAVFATTILRARDLLRRRRVGDD